MARTQPRWPEMTRIIFHGACHSGFGTSRAACRRGISRVCDPLLDDAPVLTTAVDGAPASRSAAVVAGLAVAEAAAPLPSWSISGAAPAAAPAPLPLAAAPAAPPAAAATTAPPPFGAALTGGRSFTRLYSALSLAIARSLALRWQRVRTVQ